MIVFHMFRENYSIMSFKGCEKRQKEQQQNVQQRNNLPSRYWFSTHMSLFFIFFLLLLRFILFDELTKKGG